MKERIFSRGSARSWHALVGVVAAWAVVACTSAGASPTAPAAIPTADPPNSAAPSPTTSAETPGLTLAPSPVAATPEATVQPTAAASASAEPTLGGDVDLGALIPTEIGGYEVSVSVGDGENFLETWQDTEIAQEFLDELGKTADDASTGHGFLVNDEAGLYIYAYRVAGADSAMLFDGVVQRFADLLGSDVGQATVAGKDVVSLTSSDPGAVPMYYYGYQDIVFAATSTSADWVEEVFTKLP